MMSEQTSRTEKAWSRCSLTGASAPPSHGENTDSKKGDEKYANSDDNSDAVPWHGSEKDERRP